MFAITRGKDADDATLRTVPLLIGLGESARARVAVAVVNDARPAAWRVSARARASLGARLARIYELATSRDEAPPPLALSGGDGEGRRLSGRVSGLRRRLAEHALI